MRAAVILALLVIALFLAVLFGGPSERTFDDRFQGADDRLDALSKSIEEDLQSAEAPR